MKSKNKTIQSIYIARLDDIFEIVIWHSIYSITVENPAVRMTLTFRNPVSKSNEVVIYSFKERSYKVNSTPSTIGGDNE